MQVVRNPLYAQDHWDSLSWGVIEGVEWHQNNWFDEPSSPGRHLTKQTGQATNSAPFIFNYTLLTALEDNVTSRKKVGRTADRLKKEKKKKAKLSGPCDAF